MNRRLESGVRSFAGANVKRTLTRHQVADDLDVIRKRCGVLALQEFQTRGHWLALTRELTSWASYPAGPVGLARPVWSAQAITWRRGLWRKRDTRRRRLHKGRKEISELRQLRAVLLEDRQSGQAAWFGTGHFVVGGDMRDDGDIRRGMMRGDLAALDLFLADLTHTGHPGALQLDANLTAGSTYARDPFLAILDRHGCHVHGQAGVEWLITWKGRNRQGAVLDAVGGDWTIGVGKLNTDHEVRGITFRLVTWIREAMS